MRLTCIVSFVAAVVLGIMLFANGAASILAVHVAFILMVAIFVTSAIAIIRRIAASQVDRYTDSAIPRTHRSDTRSPPNASRPHTGSHRNID